VNGSNYSFPLCAFQNASARVISYTSESFTTPTAVADYVFYYCLSVSRRIWLTTSVRFSARYQKPTQQGSSNLTRKCSTMSHGNLFILESEDRRSRSRVTKKTVPARVFTLLWVLASSSFQFACATFLSHVFTVRGSSSVHAPINPHSARVVLTGTGRRAFCYRPTHIKRLIYGQCSLAVPLPLVEWYTTGGAEGGQAGLLGTPDRVQLSLNHLAAGW